MDISKTHHKVHSTSIHMAEKCSVKNIFAPYFLWEVKKPPPNCRISKYVAGKEIWTGSIESHDGSKEKYTSLLRANCELIGEVRGERIFSTDGHIQVVK